MYQKLEQYSLIVIFFLASLWLVWWCHHNPLPDGYQNEYLHVGNAYDLWGALQTFDIWHLRWYMYTSYWPWGFYAVPWLFLALFGTSQYALVAGNLIHLIAMLVGCRWLQRKFHSPWMLWLVFLSPGVFGSLVRFEPNFAIIAWTALGLGMLVKSESLEKRRWVIGWGICLGIGLMMDRLSIVFFLLPAIVPYLWRANRKQWKNTLLAGGCTFLLTIAYYREFFIRHRQELLSQAPVGEIDSAGQLYASSGIISWLYYPLSLVDSQAGPVLGGLMLFALAHTLKESWKVGFSRNVQMLMWAWVPAVGFFTLVAKKQVFYTLPIIIPLAVWAGQYRRLSGVAVVGGLVGWLSIGWGVGGSWIPWLPERWVAPRHVLARPPSFEVWPLQESIDVISADKGEILVFSEDDRLFEGFLQLRIREAFPHRKVRGVVLDPVGSVEFLSQATVLVWMTNSQERWPSEGGIQAQLLADHYELGDLPPIAKQLANRADSFYLAKEMPAADGRLMVFLRKQQEKK